MADILKEAILEARKARQIAFHNAKEALVESLSPKLESVINRKINHVLNEEGGVDDIRKDKGKGGWANPNETDEEGFISGDGAGDVKKSNDPLKEEEEINEDDVDFDVEGDDEDELGYEDPQTGEPKDTDFHFDIGSHNDDDDMMGGGDDMGGSGMGAPDMGGANMNGQDMGAPDDEFDFDDGDDDDFELELDDDLNFSNSNLQSEEYDEDTNEYDNKIDKRTESKRIRQRRGTERLSESVKIKVTKALKENGQLKKANQILVTELRKSNLFNAKLSYTFRIIENHALTTDQKKRVVQTMDKAKTVREAALIHKTIRESLKITESKRKNNLKENASKPVGKGAEVLTEENSTKERWARLAGIVK